LSLRDRNLGCPTLRPLRAPDRESNQFRYAAPRVLARLHQSNRRNLTQPLPLRGGLGQGNNPALHLRVADPLTGRIRVLPGAKRVVEHDPGATKRPGQQLGLARGRVSAVAVTSEHPLNVTSHTDIDRCCPCRHPTSSGYPGPEGPGLHRPNTRSPLWRQCQGVPACIRRPIHR
jgi:hypothetical protein